MSKNYTVLSRRQKTDTPFPPTLRGTGSLFQAAEVQTQEGIKAKENASYALLNVFHNASPLLPGNKVITELGEGEH